MSLFSSSDALNKDLFVATYQDVVLLSALVLVTTLNECEVYHWLTVVIFQAPFGLSEFAADICGGENAPNEYLPSYRILEESIAKKLFSHNGIEDDVIAATMHAFTEKGDSAEV